jgi:hypothetical protein
VISDCHREAGNDSYAWLYCASQCDSCGPHRQSFDTPFRSIPQKYHPHTLISVWATCLQVFIFHFHRHSNLHANYLSPSIYFSLLCALYATAQKNINISYSFSWVFLLAKFFNHENWVQDTSQTNKISVLTICKLMEKSDLILAINSPRYIRMPFFFIYLYQAQAWH